MTNRPALEALVSPEHRWPADRSNPVYAHLGAWWNNAPLVQSAFGGRLSDPDSLRRASQHLQHDGLRYAVEASRRRAFRSSGTIPWQLNESYPNAWCTSAGDTWHLRLRHNRGPAALGVVLEDARPPDSPGWAVFEDNAVDLLPGESRSVSVEWREAPDAGRAVVVEGWNVEAQHVG